MLFLFIDRFDYVYLSKVTFLGEGLNCWLKIWSLSKQTNKKMMQYSFSFFSYFLLNVAFWILVVFL